MLHGALALGDVARGRALLAAMVGDYLRQSGYGFTHAADGNKNLNRH
jgi:hypothetical protein